MEAKKSLRYALLIGMLTVGSTQLSALSSMTKRIVIAVPFATTLCICSENARLLASKTYNKTAIAALHLLKHCPLPARQQEWVGNKLEETQALEATRSGENFTSDKLKSLLKEFKDLVDICKAGKDAYGWVA